MKRILIVRQHNQLGDMLCAIPLLVALKTEFPDSQLTLICSPDNYDLMRHHHTLHRLICFDKREFAPFHPARIAGFFRSLRREQCELAIVPSTVSVSSTSNILAIFSGAKQTIGPVSLNGAKNFWGRYFDFPVALDWSGDPHRHQTLRNIDMAGSLLSRVPTQECSITLTEAEREEASREMAIFRGGHQRIMVFHPGAGKAPNRWPADRFAALADAVGQRADAALLVTNGPMDDDVVMEMRMHASSDLTLLPRRPIRSVAALLSCADLVVSNDTGIMHVAAAVGSPVLSLFGPTDPLQWAPVGKKHRYLCAERGDINEIQMETVLKNVLEMLGL